MGHYRSLGRLAARLGFEQAVEFFGMESAKGGVFAADVTLCDELCERLLQAERAFFLRERYFLPKVLKSVVANVLASAVSDHEKLAGCRSLPFAVPH